jgi:gamma-glutamyltranspeptidase/glutathione hydrolase
MKIGSTLACAVVGWVVLLVAYDTAVAAPTGVLQAAAVAAPDRYSALAAQEILRQGGNAVDAAVATAFTLAVSFPEAGNIGGGGFMTLVMNGQPYFLDYRETAPGAASANMYLDSEGKPTDQSLHGNLAAGVPGTVRGMAEAHKRFGKLSWQQDLAPAIKLAREGFVVPRAILEYRKEVLADFARTGNFAAWSQSWQEGKLFRQPQLAQTLERIAQNGSDEFYSGLTAGQIVAQMSRGPVKGLITREDLASYKAVWREPLQGEWHGFRVITAPPPSSGGIALLQMLEMKADARDLFARVAFNSAEYVHLVAEIEKRVYADRAAYLGDPDSNQIPVAQLLAADYIARRAAQINPTRPSATTSIEPGLEKPQTTHFSIIDRDGNAVSNTYTLNGAFGAGVVVEGAGFLLNDEMDDFSAKPGTPNQFGVVGGEANAIAPGRRPLSSMTPTILLHDGVPAMVIGTPGGSRIFTSIFQVLVNVYDFHMPLPEAVAAPRYHHQLLPADTIFNEPYAQPPQNLRGSLERMGYRMEQQSFNGDIAAIEIDGTSPSAVADPRGRGVGLIVKP